MTTKPVLASATWDGLKLIMADPDGYRRDLTKLELGAGEQVTIRVERPEDARKYHQLKHLFGHIYRPLAKFDGCGHTELELHAICKGLFMPEGKLSTLDLNYDEMDAFSKEAERYLRTSMPEAYEAFDMAAAS